MLNLSQLEGKPYASTRGIWVNEIEEIEMPQHGKIIILSETVFCFSNKGVYIGIMSSELFEHYLNITQRVAPIKSQIWER